MDTEIIYQLKKATRAHMKEHGYLKSHPKKPTEAEIDEYIFNVNSQIGIITHEYEVNPADSHKHNHFELIYVVTGSYTQHLDDGNTVTLTEGNLCIMNPLAIHRSSISGPEDNVVVLAIKPSLFNMTFFSFFENDNQISDFFINYIMSVQDKKYLLFFNTYDKETDDIMSHIISSYLAQSPFQNTELKCLLILLFSKLLLHVPQKMQHSEKTKFTSIISYISKNVQNATLISTAEQFGFHPNYLSYYVKKNFGRTFSDILQELKLIHAKYYLSHTDLNIAQIGELLGYQNQSNFQTMFKSRTGISPGKFRESNNDSLESDHVIDQSTLNLLL